MSSNPTNGGYQLSFLDGDLRHLLRFRETILDREGKLQVICYREQASFVRANFGDKVMLRVGQLESVEMWIDIESEGLL